MALGEAVGSVEPFECAFTRTEWFADDVLWLAPEPAEPFRALTDAVWERFPRYPPYGGEFVDTIPHLTVGGTRRAERAALRVAEGALAAELPFRTRVDRVRLVAGTDSAASWRTVAEWNLGLPEVQVSAGVE